MLTLWLGWAGEGRERLGDAEADIEDLLLLLLRLPLFLGLNETGQQPVAAAATEGRERCSMWALSASSSPVATKPFLISPHLSIWVSFAAIAMGPYNKCKSSQHHGRSTYVSSAISI